MLQPFTSYVDVEGDAVAYQIAGEGPDVLFLPTIGGSHVDVRWTGDAHNAWYRELATSLRMITLDRRGLGASDHPERPLTWEDWVDDVLAVLDAARSRRCTVFALSETTPIALVLAARCPERVTSLGLFHGAARFVPGDGYPAGSRLVDSAATAAATWGRDDAPLPEAIWGPATAEQQLALRRIQRAAASPGTVRRLMAMLADTDARHVVPFVTAPVTLLRRPAWAGYDQRHAEWLLEHLPRARVVDLPGVTNLLHEEGWALVDAVRALATGSDGPAGRTRQLATVLFADVVGSTDLARTMGDHAWRQRLDAHLGAVDGIVRVNGGQVVNTSGDGTLALFDGPARAIRAGRSLLGGGVALLPVRVGVHTGEIEWRGDDVAGIGVHVGARVGALARESEVLVSRTVRDLVAGSEIRFASRGRHVLKGLDEEWELFAVV